MTTHVLGLKLHINLYHELFHSLEISNMVEIFQAIT